MSALHEGIVIYSTSSGGSGVQRFTERMRSIVTGIVKKEPPVVYLDMGENAATRTEVWAVSGKKGVYPLLFVGQEFVGDKDQVSTRWLIVCGCLRSLIPLRCRWRSSMRWDSCRACSVPLPVARSCLTFRRVQKMKESSSKWVRDAALCATTLMTCGCWALFRSMWRKERT